MGLRLVENKTKSSFKNSELGLVPLDWEIYEFADVFEFLKTGSSSRSKLSDEGQVYYIHYGDIHSKWGNRLDFGKDDIPKISEAIASTLPKLKEGDLIIADASEDYEGIGASIEIKNIGKERAVAGLHTILLRAKENKIVNGYKAYLTKIKPVKDRLIKIATGTTVYGVSKTQLKKVLVPIPNSNSEQEKIANALSDVDELIQKLEKHIRKKKLIKKGVMQELLTGRKRFSDFKINWKKLYLKDISDVFSGGTPSTKVPSNYGKGISFFTSSDLNKNRIKNSEKSITIQGFQNSSAKKIDGGTLLIALYGATAGVVAISEIDGAINQAILAITPNKNFDKDFLFYLLQLKKKDIVGRYTQGGQPNLSAKIVKELEFSFPKYNEQKKISEILNDIDEEIDSLESKFIKYQQIKSGMMQELLTGKTRLVSNQKDSSKKSVHKSTNKTHNWAINEAVVISTLVHKFGSEAYPLGRKRYTKFSYMLHRYKEKQAEGYLKKAAGPYNPSTKYGGPEKIAQQNGYIKKSKAGNFSGFVESDNIDKAIEYFCKWYGNESLTWLEQFRYCKNDELELWATVDMAVEVLEKFGKSISVEEVKNLINDHEEWRPKLKRPVFSDENISKAISKTNELFNGLT